MKINAVKESEMQYKQALIDEEKRKTMPRKQKIFVDTSGLSSQPIFNNSLDDLKLSMKQDEEMNDEQDESHLNDSIVSKPVTI